MKIRRKAFAVLLSAALLGSGILPAAVSAEEASGGFQQLLLDGAAKAAAGMKEGYTQYLDQIDMSSSAGAQLTLTLEDGGRALVGITGIDMSWFEDLTYIQDQTLKDDAVWAEGELSLNGTHIASVNVLMDTDDQNMYIQIPEVSDAWIFADLQQLQEQAGYDNEGFATANSSFTTLNVLKNYDMYLPTPEEMENLISRYGEILFSQIEDTGVEEDTISVGEISQDVTVYTGICTETQLFAVINELIDTAREDADLQSVVEKFGKVIPEEETGNLWEQLTGALDDLKNGLSSNDPSTFSDENYLEGMIWIGDEGDVRGCEFQIHSEGDEEVPSVQLLFPRDGDEVGLSLCVSAEEQTYALTGSGEIADGVLNGEYVFSMNGEDMGILTVEDTTADPSATVQEANFAISLADNEMFNQDGTLAFLKTFSLLIQSEMDTETSESNTDLIVASNGAPLGTLNIQNGLIEELEVPDVTELGTIYDMMNETDTESYTAGISIDTILANLSEAGVPDELLEMLLANVFGTGDYEEYEEYEDDEEFDSDYEEAEEGVSEEIEDAVEDAAEEAEEASESDAVA